MFLQIRCTRLSTLPVSFASTPAAFLVGCARGRVLLFSVRDFLRDASPNSIAFSSSPVAKPLSSVSLSESPVLALRLLNADSTDAETPRGIKLLAATAEGRLVCVFAKALSSRPLVSSLQPLTQPHSAGTSSERGEAFQVSWSVSACGTLDLTTNCSPAEGRRSSLNGACLPRLFVAKSGKTGEDGDSSTTHAVAVVSWKGGGLQLWSFALQASPDETVAKHVNSDTLLSARLSLQ